MAEKTLRSIVFIDAEIDFQGKVLDMGAIKENIEFHSKSRHDFSMFLYGSEFAIGHNIIDHDLRYFRLVVESL